MKVLMTDRALTQAKHNEKKGQNTLRQVNFETYKLPR